jgi:hypothetical protein
VFLRDFIKSQTILSEGGNLALDTGDEAQQIDLKVHNRAYIVPILSTLLDSINAGFQQAAGGPLWSPKVLKARKYLSGSSLHFFNTDIPDDEFERVKPKVGDIDTQVNKAVEPQLQQWLDSVKGQIVGNARFLGYSRGNEQYSSLWELTDPPIKVQIDFEFVDYDEKDQPTDWAGFSHSSSWDDMTQIDGAIKGVFHKWLIQSLTKIASEQFILRKVHKRTGKITDKVETDSMISFAVSSKEGGGLRTKYEPVLDEKGRPLEIDGLPVLRELPPSGYEKDLSKIFQAIFGERINRKELAKVLPKTWSFTGLLELANLILPQEEKEQILDSFVDKLFARGAQGLYKGDPERDVKEKNTALNYALKTLGVTPPTNLEQMRQDYVKNYRVATEGPVGLDRPIEEAEGDAPVKAQLRKGMPHLHDLKPLDFLDLLDEIHDGNGSFKLENIPLNVKVDGFGGRFGKNAEGKPFMGTSRTEPRYEPGFLKYHQQKGTQDPEILGRAQLFDNLFEEMMNAVKLVDSKLGPDFLTNKQVTCEVLFLPFATETPEGKLKFVGIQYDKLPKGVQLALVPFRVVEGDTGEDLPNSNEFIKQLLSVGRAGSVMFIDNSLTQKEGLDVTALVPPLENLEQFKAMLADKSAGSLQRKRDVSAALDPVKTALEQAIIKDPNIIGKDLLGKDYEGIVINSRLGPIKVTSQEQRDVISAKQDAKKAAWTERPRENSNKTAVVAVGSFIGHKGHEELFNYTINKAKEVGGNPYLFIGNAEGKDDPIPPAVKVQTWHKLYPEYANNISTVQSGGQLIQKIKHELINPLPGKPPRYDNIIIMVGEDRAGMNMPAALMKAVNKFQGYEHVKVSLETTPRGTGISGTALRNSLKNDTPEKALAFWSSAFDVNKLGKDWMLHLMDITKKGMGIPEQPEVQQPAPVVAERLSNALIRPRTNEATFKKSPYGRTAASQQRAKELLSPPKPPESKKDEKDSLKEFSRGDNGDDEGGDDPYKYPEPEHFNRSIDFFGQFEAEHFDEEDMNDETGEFKGYWNYDGKLRQIAYFKFDNPKRTGSNHPGMGWYYEPQNEGVAEGKEEYNRELNQKGFRFEQEINGVTYRVSNVKGGSDNIKIHALDKKQKVIGSASFWRHQYQDGLESLSTHVDPAWQGKGIATNMYAVMRMLGVNIHPATMQSDDGKKMWDKWRKNGDAKHIKSMNAKMTGVAEQDSTAMAHMAKSLENPPKVMQHRARRDQERDQQWLGTQIANNDKTSKDEWGDLKKEAMLPNSAFAGTKVGQKVGSAGQWKNTGPSKNRPARQGDLVGDAEESVQHEAKKKGADGKACWDGYRYNGTENGKDKCVKVGEDIENIMDALINKIIVNEAIQNNKR